MPDDYIKLIYTPQSWSFASAAPKISPKLAAKLEEKIATEMRAKIEARVSDICTSAMPRRARPSLTQIMGGDYVAGLTADQIAFEAAMLKQ